MGGRNIYIATLVFICILFPASLLLQDSKAALAGFEVTAFVASFTVLHALDNRQLRRERENRD
jgi:hypothetical protein